MKHARAFGLALAVICLLTVPRSFAGSDSDKDKKSHTKEKTTTTKTHTKSTTTTTTTTSHSNGQGDPSGHSTHQHSKETTSTSGSATGGDVIHTHGSTTTEISTHSHNIHQGTSNTSPHASNSHERHVDREVRVDRARLHEALHVHPGHDERLRAFDRSHVERARFERHVTAIRFVPAHRVVLNRIRIVPTTYYYRRNVFYDTYSWGAPVYVYRLYPRYGLWDTVFLAFALDHIAEEQYALMLYHHQYDAEIQQWLDDSDRLAEENDDLRAKLESMKLEMARLQDSGVAVDASYVPEDAQDVALSPEVIDQLTTKKD